jgi:hypothetical protein
MNKKKEHKNLKFYFENLHIQTHNEQQHWKTNEDENQKMKHIDFCVFSSFFVVLFQKSKCVIIYNKYIPFIFFIFF